MWTVEPLVLSVEVRVELERRVRAQTTAHRDRQRAQVVLLAADGVAGIQIAAQAGLSPQSCVSGGAGSVITVSRA